MIRKLTAILLTVAIVFNLMCSPVYASTGEERQDSGGFWWDWIPPAIVGASAGEITRIVVCALVVPEFPAAAIPCGAALAIDATGAATAVATAKAAQ